MKNLKNQITLVIIKYSVHAFKCAKNLIIMSYFLYELSLKIFIKRMFFVVIYICLIIYYFR